ncbi:MAG TPA: hypothetical protein VJB87_03860 [Candidatus Nanoarchaeia archaeon]|nr:hypothetical protein [Candidatus Nanoarchaeia archaeon]
MAEKLIITKEKQQEAMNLLSQIANPNGTSTQRIYRPVENFAKKELTPQVREDLLQSVSMKPKIAAMGDPNLAKNHDVKKISDLAKNIFNRG